MQRLINYVPHYFNAIFTALLFLSVPIC